MITETFPRDANHVPITTDGLISTTQKTLIGNNATVAVPIFDIIGTIEVRGLWGVVTTVLGANNTAAYFRLNDQTAQIYITAVGGVDISALAAGTMIVKKGVVATAAASLNNVAGVISEPTTLETTYFSPFVMVKKTGANTDIEYHYATTDTPTSGVMKHFLRWLPLSSGANVTAL